MCIFSPMIQKTFHPWLQKPGKCYPVIPPSQKINKMRKRVGLVCTKKLSEVERRSLDVPALIPDPAEQFSVEFRLKQLSFALNYALWLVSKTRATFSTNEKQNQTVIATCSHAFSRALRTKCLLRILIGSFRCLRLLWLVGVKSLNLIDTRLKTA